MSAPNTAEINFEDGTQMVVPIKDGDDVDITYTSGDYVIVYESFQGNYTMYPWRNIKNIKFTS